MKRGLVTLDPAQIPRAAYDARIDAVRARLEGSGAEVALIYGDVSRSGDINFLSNLCLYWNEAVLAIPREGAPVLITKLSKRVTTWMRQTSVLDQIVSGPRLAESVGKLLDDHRGGRKGALALVDLSWWPNNLVNQLRKTLPEMELRDLGSAVREERLRPSPEERRLLETGAHLMDYALALAWSEPTPDARTSAAVRALRRSGFQEATVSCATLGDGSEFVDATGQYRDVWLRQSRPRGGPAAAAADAALSTALAAARPGTSEATLARLSAGQAAGRQAAFSCFPHADLETRGLYRGAGDAARVLRADEVVCVAVTLAGDEAALAAAATVRITEHGAEPLFRKEGL
ncbi:MAG TPA: aminopeptidase P family N-terminal domain-containing protein [Steroidobacteraceae bacterium]|nr:aminopeptidase P family N-terminal domain-containing protein [Steroidobacteraceae bacterium]